jgi:uncharacterized protein (DUF1697 family)
MSIKIVLLRGINVGAHNRIAMAELRELLAELGYGGARTLLQSGNVVLDADAAPEQLAGELERQIADRFGVRTPVVVRTRQQLDAAIVLNPLGDIADDPKRYQVSFLSAEPTPEAMRAIAAVEVAPECFVHVGREIYAWHPRGVHDSPLAKLLSDKRLGVVATARNWNTVTKLAQLAQQLDGDQ